MSVSGDVAAVAARVSVMDAAFEEAGLEFTAVAHQAHAGLALMSGHPDEAIQHSTRAAELALATGDLRWAAVFSALLAHILVTLGHTDEGIERAEHALRLASEIGSRLPHRRKRHSGMP